jgi:hypothetical protein
VENKNSLPKHPEKRDRRFEEMGLRRIQAFEPLNEKKGVCSIVDL